MEGLSLKGHVASGIGKGKHFLSIKRYKNKIHKKIGIWAYEGTLNIKVNTEDRKVFLYSETPIKINAFKINGRGYGGIWLYKAKINGISGAIIVPLKTNHGDDIIEFIADINLRNKLKLKDKGKVTLTMEDD